jgi:hypothetical protein
MRNKILGALAVVLLGIGALVFLPREVPSPGPALIDTSMLLPGMNCRLTLASPTDSQTGAIRQYSGVVADVSPKEIILDDAAYEEGAAELCMCPPPRSRRSVSGEFHWPKAVMASSGSESSSVNRGTVHGTASHNLIVHHEEPESQGGSKGRGQIALQRLQPVQWLNDWHSPSHGRHTFSARPPRYHGSSCLSRHSVYNATLTNCWGWPMRCPCIACAWS